MLQSLFRRAEATVDQAVTGLVTKVVVAIPFLVACGFATAAAAILLNRAFGTEVGCLIMTGVFVVIGGVAVMVASSRTSSSSERSDEPAQTADETSTREQSALEGADRELLSAALTAIGPLAAPPLLRLAVRNLPLIAAIAAAGFVLSRAPGNGSQSDLRMEPAE